MAKRRVFPLKMSAALVEAIQPYLPGAHVVDVRLPDRRFALRDYIVIDVKILKRIRKCK